MAEACPWHYLPSESAAGIRKCGQSSGGIPLVSVECGPVRGPETSLKPALINVRHRYRYLTYLGGRDVHPPSYLIVLASHPSTNPQPRSLTSPFFSQVTTPGLVADSTLASPYEPLTSPALHQQLLAIAYLFSLLLSLSSSPTCQAALVQASILTRNQQTPPAPPPLPHPPPPK